MDRLQESIERMGRITAEKMPTVIVSRELEILAKRLIDEYPDLLDSKPYLKCLLNDYERSNLAHFSRD